MRGAPCNLQTWNRRIQGCPVQPAEGTRATPLECAGGSKEETGSQGGGAACTSVEESTRIPMQGTLPLCPHAKPMGAMRLSPTLRPPFLSSRVSQQPREALASEGP